MPWFRVANFDSAGGAIADVPPQAVPPAIFTDVNNVVFKDGAAEKATGMAAELASPPDTPYFILPTRTNAGDINLFAACGDAICKYNGSGWTDISRAVGGAYPVAGNNEWTGGVLHGVPFMNIAGTYPQYWDISEGVFKDLENWPSGHTCSALRAFRNYLLALDYSSGATRYPHNILWSNPADPGTIPNSWDITSTSGDAGTSPLSETSGYIVDGWPLGQSFVIYKEGSIYLMQFSGAPFIFTFQLASRETGVLSRNCVAEVRGAHAVFGPDDVYLFNGQTPKSLVNRKWRREIFANISNDNFQRAFVMSLPEVKEVWFCTPVLTTQASIAYVWNWGNDSWSKRDLPTVTSIARGISPWNLESWDSASGTWDTDTTPWTQPQVNVRETFLASSDGEIYTLGAAETMPSGAMTAYAMHESFDFATEQNPDAADRVKHVSKLRPRILATAGTVLKFQMGTQMNINDAITWGTAQSFTVGADEELCMAVNGRYISWKVYSECNCTWRLEALDFLLQVGGRY